MHGCTSARRRLIRCSSSRIRLTTKKAFAKTNESSRLYSFHLARFTRQAEKSLEGQQRLKLGRRLKMFLDGKGSEFTHKRGYCSAVEHFRVHSAGKRPQASCMRLSLFYYKKTRRNKTLTTSSFQSQIIRTEAKNLNGSF